MLSINYDMKWSVFVLLALVLIPACAMAVAEGPVLTDSGQFPTMELLTNKESYSAGDSGFVVLRLDTYGMMDSADIEIEILSPSGKLVEGDILYTDIPEETVLNPETKQTVQVVYEESVEYFGPEKTIIRMVEFEIPMDVLTGDYMITGMASGGGSVLEQQKTVHITGPGGFMDYIFLVYIAMLVYSLYLLRRE
jgi:hypothetical protein